MGIVAILVGMALICLGIFGWLWLCDGFRKPGWLGLIGKQTLQLSALCLVYGFVSGHPINGIFMASFPPLALGEVAKARLYQEFITEVAWRVAPWAGATLVLSIMVPRLRVWGLGLTLFVGLGAALFLGDQVSQDAMCRTAIQRGFSKFERNSFYYSLANTRGDKFYDSPHAISHFGGQTRGWSYREMDWFVFPTGVGGTDPPFTCP